MPWYWTDEIASVLVSRDGITKDDAARLTNMPVAHRSERETIDSAIQELLDEGEIPLAA